jgi:hypothetical protein
MRIKYFSRKGDGMPGKLSNRILNLMAMAACALLVALAWMNLNGGEAGLSALLMLGAIAAMGLAWLTRRPFEPRSRYRQQEQRARRGRRSRA